MTPQEFYENHFQKPMKEMALKIDKFSSSEMWEFAQAYADHLEMAQWVTDGSLPPKNGINHLSVNVNISIGGRVYGANYNFKTGFWESDGYVYGEGFAWRPLPSPPSIKK